MSGTTGTGIGTSLVNASSGGGGAGTVTSVTGGTTISGGPITTSGTLEVIAGLLSTIQPSSSYTADTVGNSFPNFYSGAGGNASPTEYGLGVAASLNADTTWQLRFPVPQVLPKGTLKLRLLQLANATSGVAKFTVSDGKCPAGTSPSGVTLTSETQSSVTWAAGDNDKYKETKVTLTTAPAGGDMLVIAIVFNTTSWTLAQILTTIPTIIWE